MKTRIDGEPTETMTITVPVKLSSSPRYARGNMHMKYDMCKVSQGDTQIGWVSGCVGGGVDLHNEATGETWFVSAADLWEAFHQAIEKEVGENHHG